MRRMKTKKSLGKVSSFLRDRKKPNPGFSAKRNSKRNPLRMPSSTKVGAGDAFVLRSNLIDVKFRRNHRKGHFGNKARSLISRNYADN